MTPSFSDADRYCVYQAQWWQEFKALGGNESRIVGIGYHRYRGWSEVDFTDALDICLATLAAAGVPPLPVWLTEAGQWFNCGQPAVDAFRVWLEQALEHPRIAQVMIYAPLTGSPFCSLVNAGALTPYGWAVRTAGVPAWPAPTPTPGWYP